MQNDKHRTRYRTFSYSNGLEWLENRSAMLTADGRPPLRVSSPPEFKGEAGVWTPEDLFVAAVNICTMTTFLAFANRKNIAINSYKTHAEGILEFENGKYKFTRILLRPAITVEHENDIEGVRQTLHDAHRSCLIANSINAVVAVEPEIKSSRADKDNVRPRVQLHK